MTVSKAYGLLEERGYLTRLRGKGMIVAKRDDEVSALEKLTVLNNAIENILADAQQMGVSQQQLLALFEQQIAATYLEPANTDNKE